MTKSHDTRRGAAEARPLASEVEVAVSFQNGVEKDRLLAQWCGADRVIGAMSMAGGDPRRSRTGEPHAAGHELPRRAPARTHPARPCAGRRPRGRRDAGHPQRADPCRGVVKARSCRSIDDDHRPAAAAVSPGTAGSGSGRPVRTAATRGRRVAAGDPDASPLEDLPGMFPVHWLSTVERGEAVEIVQGFGRRMQAAGSTNVITSMLRDLQRGRRLELDAVHGFLVAEARRSELDVPYSLACLELLQALDPHALTAAA